jgi:hypothetical protein
MSNTAWLFVALIIIFAGIIGYASVVAARTKAVRDRLEEKRNRESVDS